MNSALLVASSIEFAKKKKIDKPTIIRMLEDVIRTLIDKRFGSDASFSIIINLEKGDIEIARLRTIVDNDSDQVDMPEHIALAEAQEIEKDFEVGEEVYEQVDLGSFTRREVDQIRQAMVQKLQIIDRTRLYEYYKKLVGQLIYAEVYHITPWEVALYHEYRNKVYLPKSEQLSGERYKKGATLCAVVHEVTYDQNHLRVVLSRTSNEFLIKLMEREIPGVGTGSIEIKHIVRRPGMRAKVIVDTQDDRIDPVGACIGVSGVRILAVVKELKGEQVDVINYTDDPNLLLRRCLSPAKINRIEPEGENGIALYVDSDQAGIAIGSNAQNIDLAGRLVGKQITVYKEVSNEEGAANAEEEPQEPVNQ